MSELSELHRDALSELFNLGVGRAAHSLSQMVRDEIELSAPFVDVIQAHEVSAVLIGSEFRELSMVTIDFEGPFVSKAILLFPERNALAILSNMLDPDLTPEEVSEFEQEAMCEIGNVILNACMSALADEFGIELYGSLPKHYFSDTDSLPIFVGGNAEQRLLLLQIQLTMRQQLIQGHLVFLMGVGSLLDLRNCLDAYLDRLGMR
ncbi:chemotaxis protein CheX [Thermochromatium tepidum]|uniref:Chemotaxis protein CheC n=1 Tax=Thermochromatium tepidum ATCC 43061 TaxID=316276 RepID=A0A6I6E8Z7_THETI|nr:chemotaxis protein CheX [Thermochromatium tepidum]QGU33058.1 chemotaxis protein CheC [Thermochromatium tepidum ATCC 43061]